MGYLAPGNAGLGKTYPPDFLKRVDKKGFDVVKPKKTRVTPKTKYVVIGAFPDGNRALCVPGGGWTPEGDARMFWSRASAATAIAWFPDKEFAASLRVMTLRDWDRLRIQTAISAP